VGLGLSKERWGMNGYLTANAKHKRTKAEGFCVERAQ
jgi:hypothetical protein